MLDVFPIPPEAQASEDKGEDAEATERVPGADRRDGQEPVTDAAESGDELSFEKTTDVHGGWGVGSWF